MRKKISVKSILLALDNPRLENSATEQEEMKKMVDQQGEKLYRLAQDIALHGLNPNDIMAVYPSDTDGGKYIVAEGNRRLTVIKCLNNPELLKDISHNLYGKFKKLATTVSQIGAVEVNVFTDAYDPELLHWMEIKHMGEQSGKGTSSWDSVQKARYQVKQQGISPLLDFWEQLKMYRVLTQTQISEITKTNWERILRNTGIEFLEIKKQDKKLLIPLENLQSFKRKMQIIHKLLAGKTVGDVYDQTKIEEFFAKVELEYSATEDCDIADSEEKFENKDSLTNSSSTAPSQSYEPASEKENDIEFASTGHSIAMQNTGTEQKWEPGSGTSDPPDDLEVTNPQQDIFYKCKTIIPKQLEINSSNTRINQVINELRILDPEKMPNACGTLLRALFELSAKVCLENITGVDQTDTEFQPVINSAARELVRSGVIHKQLHSSISKEVDLLRNLFNGYMHNTDAYPSAETMRSAFKAQYKFLKACLQAAEVGKSSGQN